MKRINQKQIPAAVLKSLLAIEHHIKTCGLDIKLVELIKFRVSQINHCAYCLDMHYKIATRNGEDPQRLYSVSAWRETDYYTEREKAALQFAEHLTLIQGSGVSEVVFEEMKQHFSDEEIANICTVVVQINTWNRTTKVFDQVAGSFQIKEYEMAH